MDLRTQTAETLQQLVGLQTDEPNIVEFTDQDGNRLVIDLRTVETLSCSFRKLQLIAPSIQHASLEELKAWAQTLSERLTYLLENIGPLEFDADGKQILLRSNPPGKRADETVFYELILHAQAGGTLTLCRYRSESGRSGRESVDILATCEMLRRLVEDIVDSIPA